MSEPERGGEEKGRLAGVTDRARRTFDTAVGAVREGNATALRKARGLVEGMLDRVFGEHFDVPDDEHAVELLSQEVPKSGAAQFAVNAAATKALPKLVTALVSRATWLGRIGGPGTAAATTGVALAANPAQEGIRRVLWDLRVISSYLATRAREAGIELERPVVRAVSVAVLVDHHRRVDHRYARGKASTVVVRAMAREAGGKMTADERAVQARARIERVRALDLAEFQDGWQREHGATELGE